MQKLVAIMYTDIVGYTSITEENGALAQLLNKKHKHALTENVAKFKGVLQELVGDGSLSYFTSASNCVQCAIALQEMFRTEPPVPVRIGIHIGEIKGENDLVYGNPLNVASRIESIAVAGSILSA
ncbi:MAG: adenylate/guanylate cyclase domain-containing protein [Saprospiraceae bacterium]